MKEKNKLKIAIQKKGRLTEGSIDYLASLGIKPKPSGRKLISGCENSNFEILYLRSADIPEYVSRGVADFGIVGQNVVIEKNLDVKEVKPLDFGQCKLVIAIPTKSLIKNIKDLEGERIVTSYPKTLQIFLKDNLISAAIIPIQGSVEITTNLGLADAICDLTQTGNTLKENNLVPLWTILESKAVLIESPFNNPNKNQFLKLCK